MKRNKWIALALAASLFSASALVTPKKAEAAAGLLTLGTGLGVPLAIAGGVGVVAGITVIASCSSDVGCFFSNLLGAALVIAGIGLLDDEKNPDVAFTALSAEDGSHLGLNELQIRKYYEELPEINAIRDSIRSEAVDQLRAGKDVKMDDIHRLWQDNSGSLSPEAFSALEKVSGQIAAAASRN